MTTAVIRIDYPARSLWQVFEEAQEIQEFEDALEDLMRKACQEVRVCNKILESLARNVDLAPLKDLEVHAVEAVQRASQTQEALIKLKLQPSISNSQYKQLQKKNYAWKKAVLEAIKAIASLESQTSANGQRAKGALLIAMIPANNLGSEKKQQEREAFEELENCKKEKLLAFQRLEKAMEITPGLNDASRGA